MCLNIICKVKINFKMDIENTDAQITKKFEIEINSHKLYLTSMMFMCDYIPCSLYIHTLRTSAWLLYTCRGIPCLLLKY